MSTIISRSDKYSSPYKKENVISNPRPGHMFLQREIHVAMHWYVL